MRFKTFQLYFGMGDINAGFIEGRGSISQIIEKQINNWRESNPKIELLDLKQSCTDYNGNYVMQISIVYKDAA